jgi:hypothetical protein
VLFIFIAIGVGLAAGVEALPAAAALSMARQLPSVGILKALKCHGAPSATRSRGS